MSIDNMKKYLEEAADLYGRLSDWQQKRAKTSAPGSDKQIDLLIVSHYNRGRANAMKEALDFLNECLEKGDKA